MTARNLRDFWLIVGAFLLLPCLLIGLAGCESADCPEGQHYEDQGFMSVIPIVGPNGSMTMMPYWQSVFVCVTNGTES